MLILTRNNFNNRLNNYLIKMRIKYKKNHYLTKILFDLFNYLEKLKKISFIQLIQI